MNVKRYIILIIRKRAMRHLFYLWSVSETKKSVLENEIIKMVIDNISDREVKDVMKPLFSEC